MAYTFIYTSSTRLSIITRLVVPITILLYLLIGPFLKLRILPSLLHILPALTMVLAILYLCGSFRRVLGGLQFVAIFSAAGLAINAFAKIFNLWIVDIVSVAVSSLRGALMFVTIALVFQWIKIGEVRWLLERIGLGRLGAAIAIAFSQLPCIIVMYSESLVTVRLKHGSRYLYKAVLPLILYSANHAREIAEAMYIHGIPGYPVQTSMRVRDVAVIVVSITVLLGSLYTSISINT
ncbi:MAG: hypothetical protein RMI45_01320 [Ignisphaera sp.]|nr:hypothetical protein [Ignisphaera sp.]MDW8084868.1 hypothetical protein [Ignisphaera sp.]